MKKRNLMILSILIFTWGCASHYYKSNQESLYVYLKKPEANSVFFLCSIDGFKYHPARKIDGKIWEIQVPPNLGFKYFYVVDGEPFVPDCKFKEADDFGSDNCIYDPIL